MVTKFCQLQMEHPAAVLGGNEDRTFFREEDQGDVYYNDAPASLYSPGDCEDAESLMKVADGNETVQKAWREFSQQEVCSNNGL